MRAKFYVIVFFTIFFNSCINKKSEELKEVNLKSVNGNLILSGKLDQDGNRIGEWKEYYPNGRLLSLKNYDAKFSEYGHTKMEKGFYEDGTIKFEGKEQELEKGKKFEYTYYYYYPNGLLRFSEHHTIEFEYLNEEYDEFTLLQQKTYSKNGIIQIIDFFENDEQYKSEYYNSNGVLEYTLEFSNDEIEVIY